MSDETAIIPVPGAGLADVAMLADEYARSTRLARYHEGLRDETLRRQRTDLLTFARFLASIGVQVGDFYHDLNAWQGISAGLLEAFIEWQKLQGYAIGSVNVRLATVNIPTQDRGYTYGSWSIAEKQARRRLSKLRACVFYTSFPQQAMTHICTWSRDQV